MGEEAYEQRKSRNSTADDRSQNYLRELRNKKKNESSEEWCTKSVYSQD